MAAINPPYTVYLHYPSRTNDNEKGITIDYRRDVIRTCRTRDEAIDLARRQQLREKDYVYVEHRPGKDDPDYHVGPRTIFHRNPKSEHFHV
jgi:hypothetical protein